MSAATQEYARWLAAIRVEEEAWAKYERTHRGRDLEAWQVAMLAREGAQDAFQRARATERHGATA